MVTFNDQLKQFRKARGLTQADVARRTGLPQSYISKVESGQVDLRMSTFVEIARSLDIEPMLVPFSYVPLVEQFVGQSGDPVKRNNTVHARGAFVIGDDDES